MSVTTRLILELEFYAIRIRIPSYCRTAQTISRLPDLAVPSQSHNYDWGYALASPACSRTSNGTYKAWDRAACLEFTLRITRAVTRFRSCSCFENPAKSSALSLKPNDRSKDSSDVRFYSIRFAINTMTISTWDLVIEFEVSALFLTSNYVTTLEVPRAKSTTI